MKIIEYSSGEKPEILEKFSKSNHLFISGVSPRAIKTGTRILRSEWIFSLLNTFAMALSLLPIFVGT